jgi:hypothetical protein
LRKKRETVLFFFRKTRNYRRKGFAEKERTHKKCRRYRLQEVLGRKFLNPTQELDSLRSFVASFEVKDGLSLEASDTFFSLLMIS